MLFSGIWVIRDVDCSTICWPGMPVVDSLYSDILKGLTFLMERQISTLAWTGPEFETCPHSIRTTNWGEHPWRGGDILDRAEFLYIIDNHAESALVCISSNWLWTIAVAGPNRNLCVCQVQTQCMTQCMKRTESSRCELESISYVWFFQSVTGP